MIFRYGGIYLDQDVLTLRSLFSDSSFHQYDDPDLGDYSGIVTNEGTGDDVITRAALTAQKDECR